MQRLTQLETIENSNAILPTSNDARSVALVSVNMVHQGSSEKAAYNVIFSSFYIDQV
jgi:hypothetical protein